MSSSRPGASHHNTTDDYEINLFAPEYNSVIDGSLSNDPLGSQDGDDDIVEVGRVVNSGRRKLGDTIVLDSSEEEGASGMSKTMEVKPTLEEIADLESEVTEDQEMIAGMKRMRTVAMDNELVTEIMVPPNLPPHSSSQSPVSQLPPLDAPIPPLPALALTEKVDMATQTPSETCHNIDLIIFQVVHADLRVSMNALKQLRLMIEDKEKVGSMSSSVDNMLSMISLQICRQQAGIEGANQEKLIEINGIFNYAVKFLKPLLNNDILLQRASQATIQNLIQNLIQLIIDPGLLRLSEGETIRKKINDHFFSNIIKSGDINTVTCAVIRLLNETLTRSKQEKMLDLVQKCSWKLWKHLSTLEQKDCNWDVIGILTECHLLIKSQSFKMTQNDSTVLWVKAIVDKLKAEVGCEMISEHLNQIPGIKESEFGLYIRDTIEK